MAEMEQNILLILLLRVGYMAALASLVVALKPLRELVTGDRSGSLWRLARVGLEATVLGAGVWARTSLQYPAADLSLEGVFLIGWAHGPVAGAAVGFFLGLIESWGGSWAPLAFLPLAGLLAGELVIWYPEVAGWSAGVKVGGREAARESAVGIAALLSLESMWVMMGAFGVAPRAVPVTGVLPLLGVLISSVISVITPLWIWRGLRMEAELARRTSQMEKVRMESLMERFRPHFLFNTLGAIVSLMRTDVEGARNMTLKLAGLLRRSMRDGEDFVPLKDELRFVRDYLDIEAIRHGDRLKVIEVIDEDTLDVRVPRMVLQPLVENAIIHGIDPKMEGGSVTIRANRSGNFLRIEVADDGVGIESTPGQGIGLANLRARLEAAYGGNASRVEISGAPGEGARAVLWIPMEKMT